MAYLKHWKNSSGGWHVEKWLVTDEVTNIPLPISTSFRGLVINIVTEEYTGKAVRKNYGPKKIRDYITNSLDWKPVTFVSRAFDIKTLFD